MGQGRPEDGRTRHPHHRKAVPSRLSGSAWRTTTDGDKQDRWSISEAAGDTVDSPRPDPASSGPGHPQGFTLFLHWAGVCWPPQTRSCLITTPQRCAPDAQSFLLHLPLWKSAQSLLAVFHTSCHLLARDGAQDLEKGFNFRGGSWGLLLAGTPR